ncbi:MAG: acetyl-CoA carboxylase biotin carboxyl carrier protein [Candidatus Gastranaerophilales bacterium]|nr:acetyl-CoA carboxylase biotin carboxyl carrier protein [Candidatus Gastranaerophilales bacterium]
MQFDFEYIEKLVKLVSDSELSELVLEDSEQAIVLKKNENQVISQVVPSSNMAQIPLASVGTVSNNTQTVVETKEEEVKEKPKGKPITSPMVGTFYKAPSPDASPFVTVGDMVATGQVVCIIEAMKMMNEIEAEVSGRVVEICVADGQSVEYGQVLMYVE